jgi:hypothetical protein
LPDNAEWTDLENSVYRFELYQHDDCRCRGDRRSSVEDDAQRTVISVGIDRVHVGDLDDCEQRQQS